MVSLRRSDFAAFFAAIHDGHEPFRWQERLLDQLLDTGVWPQRIEAPTGSGKTAVIDVHVFAVALNATGTGPRLPRRLAMVVGRRVLVDDQYEHVVALANRLGQQPLPPVLAAAAAALRTLRWPLHTGHGGGERVGRPAADQPSPLVTGRLRGGAVPSRSWRDHPTACAVLCATPDMWGSRLLFRGYGSSPRAWPREAGLLAVDSVVVVDEAHLSRQLLTTARRTAQLVAVAQAPLPVPGLQVVETTATPPPTQSTGPAWPLDGPSSLGVDPDDLDQDTNLQVRLRRPKPVRLLPVKQWPGGTLGQRRHIAGQLAGAVLDMLHTTAKDGPAADTVGCFVNTVAMAVSVTDELHRRTVNGDQPRVVMICGQARPADLDQLRHEHPGILRIDGCRNVDVIVATQSLEVGVDLDLAGVVTELAPGSALAQRVGRANRRGIRDSVPVTVVVPADAIIERTRSGIYGSEDLTAALDWITRRVADPLGVAPWALRDSPPPAASAQRQLWQRPELADAWHWARTSDELAAEPQLDLWLTESFEEDTTVGVVVRDAMPPEAADAIRLIRAIPPRDREIFAVPYRSALAVLTGLAERHAAAAQADQSQTGLLPSVVRVRGEDVAVLAARVNDQGERRIDIRPGDIVVLDATIAAFTASTSRTDAGFSPPVLLGPQDPDAPDLARHPAADVCQTLPAGTTSGAQPQMPAGWVTLRLEAAVWVGQEHNAVAHLIKVFAAEHDQSTERQRRTGLAHLLRDLLPTLNGQRLPMVCAAADLLQQPVKHSDVVLHRNQDDQPLRLLVLDRRRAGTDERLRQTWSTSNEAVTLTSHQHAVAARAALLGEQVGLPEPLVEVLAVAGAHHDDGKADQRFQARLGAPNTHVVLAKSRPDLTAAQSQRLAQQAAVPEQWRHEQRSVVESWHALHTELPPEHRPLAARLIGTSHGHGRSGFPHTATQLLRPDDPPGLRRRAEDLFDLGAWDELIEHTHQRWGLWGCAYLEAVLRAADGQVSGEGR